MPVPAYLTLIGEKQGLISSGASSEGSVGKNWQTGREDQILVQSYSHRMSVDSGMSGGRRRHHALSITKIVDKSSPLINYALCSREVLTSCRLELYRVSTTGGIEHFYTTELKGAMIQDVEVIMPDCKDAELGQYTQLERVKIAYREITWSHEVSRTTTSDSWLTQYD